MTHIIRSLGLLDSSRREDENVEQLVGDVLRIGNVAHFTA